jgi:hypothetical protein
MTAMRFIGMTFRTILYAVVGAILSGLMIRGLLIPFPNSTGDKGLAIIMLVFGGVVAGAISCGAGFLAAKHRSGAIWGAVSALMMWIVLMKHVPDEPQLVGYLLVLVTGPVLVGLLGSWIGQRYAQRSDNTNSGGGLVHKSIP